MTPVFPSPRRKRVALRVSSAVLTLMLGTGFVPSLSPRAAFAQADKFYLLYRAQTGQSEGSREDGTITIEAQGQSIALAVKSTSKSTFTKVAPTGELTIENVTLSQEATMNGKALPPQPLDEPTTYTIKPDGELVSYVEGKKKDAEEGGTDEHTDVRLHQASTVLFPHNTVSVGDKWAHDYKADTTLGTRDAHADFELTAFEKIGDVNTAKIKMTYAESGSDAVTLTGTFNVDVATGDTVKQDAQIAGIPYGEGTKASASFHAERTDGAPFAANQTPKPLTEAPKGMVAEKPKPGDKPAPGAKPGEAAIPAAPPKAPEPKKDKTIDETVKDGFVKVPGVVTLWRKKEPGSDKIYAEVTDDQFNKLMILQATAATGTADQILAGDPINDIVFQLEKIDDRVFLTVPNFAFRAATPEIARAVRRSYADGYLQAFKIEAKQAERKSVLIDVSDLFKGDIAQISAIFSGGGSPFGGASGGYGLDRDKTFIKEIKNFPENLVVATQYHFQKGGRGFSATLADARSAPITVIYNLSVLPTSADYTPRLSDPRVGFFETQYQSFDDDTVRDQMVRYVLRWNLQKKDPNAALSEPVKPIVFWLDNAIPKEYRPAFEKGFTTWNPVFEKLGYKNAIVVKQMPDNPDPKDPNTPTDTADMRFNCVRYSPANAGYAVALFRSNPITGQILNASITVDAGFANIANIRHEHQVGPASAFALGAGVPQEEARYAEAQRAKSGETTSPLGLSRFNDPRYCSLAEGGKQSAAFGYQALSALSATGTLSPADQKEFVSQYITSVVAHEFGHVLGLRHNFVASKEYTTAQLGNKAVTDAGGVAASVMDYLPFNISAIGKPGAAYYGMVPGTYDNWAIEYGYQSIPSAKTPDAEKPVLARTASASGLPGHAYLSDEVRDQFDPDVCLFDMAKDNLAYHKQNMELSKRLIATLDKREPKNGESYYEFTQDFDLLLGTYSSAAGFATRFIGGQNISHTHRGDAGEKAALTTVSPDTQRQALAILNTYILAPNALPVPKRYYAKMASDPNGYFLDEAQMLDNLSGLQRFTITRLFSATVLRRIANNEFKATGTEKPLTLPYLFNTVSSNVWAEVATKTNVDALRRNLQRAHLDRMADIALKGNVNADAQMLAWNELRGLKAKLVTAKANPALDAYTKAHYADSLDKITRTLDARVTLGGAAAPSAADLLSLLFGRPKDMIAAPDVSPAP